MSSLFISPSPFSCFTRLRLLFLHGRFETDLTDAPVRTVLPNFPDPKARVKRTSARATSSLTTWPSPSSTQVMSPKELDKITSVDDDTTPINDPNDNISDFSKTPRGCTGQFGVSTVFESSVLHVSHGDFVPQRESKESMQLGNRCKTERRKRKFCAQCCRVDVKEKSTEQHQESFSSDSQRILF